MIKRKKSPSACAMVWIVASDKGIHSRASSHKPMRCAKSSLYAASTHSRTTCNPQGVAIFKYQEKALSGDSMYRHVLPASISRGKLHVDNDDGHRTSASATEDVRDVGQRMCLARALLLDVPIRKLHATRRLCTTRNDRTLISWRSRMTSTVLFVLVTNGGIVIKKLLSTQQPTKWRRVDVVKSTVQHPDVGSCQEQR